MDIVTPRLVLVAVSDGALAQEEAGRPPELAGVVATDWPPEHWEPHVFPWIRAQHVAHPQTRGWHRYVVLSAGSQEPARLIGTLGASPKPEGGVEFGYSILPAFQRRGYGTEAALAFVEWLSGQAGVRSITAQTYPSLTGSIKVMEACGLVADGAGDDEGTVRYRKLL